MGAPKRNRKKYERPSAMWNKQRIEEEHKLKEVYGLKNLRELWKATSELRRVKRNAREVLSGRSTQKTGTDIINRLAICNIVKEDAIADDLLVLKPESILERRLQTVVFRRGMAKSLRQSRQLIAHGFIAINGSRVKSPGYLVRKDEESNIGYYKPINLEIKPVAEQSTAEQTAVKAEPAQASGGEGE